MTKLTNSYKTIGEVVKILKLKSRNNQSSPTHTIRYWEKEFKQIKPKILNGNRRYYNKENIELLKKDPIPFERAGDDNQWSKKVTK